MFSSSDLRKLKCRIAYSIQKNIDFIDFSNIPNSLELRYLLKDILILREHYKRLRNEKKND